LHLRWPTTGRPVAVAPLPEFKQRGARCSCDLCGAALADPPEGALGAGAITLPRQ
jgi:hypothetical protein